MIYKKKRRTLRRLFFTRFFFFNLLPLIFLAFIIRNQYTASINQQIKDRLTVHVRELESLFAKDRREIEKFLRFVQQDKSFIYYLSTLEVEPLKENVGQLVNRFSLNRVKVYTYAGQVITFYDKTFRSVHQQPDLPEGVRQRLETEGSINQARFVRQGDRNVLLMSQVQKIIGVQNKTVGYVEAFLPLDEKQLSIMGESTGAEIVFFDTEGKVLLGTLPAQVASENIEKNFLKGSDNFIEFTLNGTPFAFISTSISWGAKRFMVGVGSSKASAEKSIRRVNYAILSAFVSIIFFLLLMSYFGLREFILPIESLIKASEKMKESRDLVFIENNSRTEIADLIDSFNEMSQKISESESQMKSQVHLLEEANTKIKKTQGQLVQSAKLASLGELVAGIAHELNNPVGFIYSNIGHLKEYTKALFKVIDGADKGPEELARLKEEVDYQYIKQDFPKLIQSCEEGAVRAKEIVIGLRNFSHSDESQAQPFDVNKGIDSTLRLLSGELKNRIQVDKNFGEIPLINGNANQLKQVFMNILGNACQAIENEGTIAINTEFLQEKKAIQISIKDSGVGIPPESIEKIFDPFFTTKSVGEGTGLGLSISYGIIKSHGGEIGVRSTLGQGTEFVIHLPVYKEVTQA